MSVRINLPPGCQGFDPPAYRARAGTSVTVSDEYAAALKYQGAGSNGLISTEFQSSGGTRKGRWCMRHTPPRLWNVWSLLCPKCGAETSPEQ